MRVRMDGVYRLSVAILGDEADARDAAQETFITAWRQIRSVRDPAKFDAWLQRVAVNAARMTHRSRQLVWTGGMCDGDTVVTIDDELRTVRVEATQDGGCDAIGVERRLVIDVDGPIDPAAVEVRYTETSAGAS